MNDATRIVNLKTTHPVEACWPFKSLLFMGLLRLLICLEQLYMETFKQIIVHCSIAGNLIVFLLLRTIYGFSFLRSSINISPEETTNIPVNISCRLGKSLKMNAIEFTLGTFFRMSTNK